MFDHSMWRFAISGTLILLYGIGDHLARRRGARHKTPSPRWVKPLIFVSITAYYVLIGPTGGALLGGVGNVVGIALVGAAIALRHSRAVQYPDLAGRSLFYVALPIAVGVPWGLLVLSLPALASSLYVCRKDFEGARVATLDGPRHRLVPGVW